jgi:molybdenum cofactor biosynthesis protein MoaC
MAESPVNLKQRVAEDHNMPDQAHPKNTAVEERDQELLRAVWEHGIAESPLPWNLEAVRQKHAMAGPEYNYYWRLAAGSQLTGEAYVNHASAKARRELRALEQKKLGMGKLLPQFAETTSSHKALMSEAWRMIANGTRNGPSTPRDELSTFDAAVETKDLAKSTDGKPEPHRTESEFTPRVRLSESLLNPSLAVSAKHTREPFSSGESNFTTKENTGPATHTVTLKVPGKVTTGLESLGSSPVTKRALWRARKRLAHLQDENSAREVILQQEKQVRELKRKWTHEKMKIKPDLAASPKARREAREAVKKVPMDSPSHTLGERFEGLGQVWTKLPTKATTEIASNATVKMAKKAVEEEATNAQEVADKNMQKEAARLDELRNAKAEMLKKKPLLLQQLQATDEGQQRPIRAENRREKVRSYDLDDILDVAMDKVNPGVRWIASVKEQLYKAKVYRPLASPVSESSPDIASTNIVSPIKGGWSLYDGSTREAPAENQSSSVQSTQADVSRIPTGDIRLNVPSSGEVYIDSDLTLQLNAKEARLKSQISQIQNRLKASYPRIDTLPYDVTGSGNKQTLQTWLKILASRWHTRFDEADSLKGMSVIEAQVKAVLDQMVRDHDLNNAAAKRMAEKWVEVFKKRGAMNSDAGGSMDLDELDADGMGFLNNYGVEETENVEQSELENVQLAAQSTGLSGQDVTETSSYEHGAEVTDADTTIDQDEFDTIGMSFLRNDDADASYNVSPSSEPPLVNSVRVGNFDKTPRSTERRMYSTSSRPPLDPTLAPKSDQTNTSEPASTTPSLPHLTASGSAHMVSVSAKPHTVRTAIAVGTVTFSNPVPLGLIKTNSLKKGDVLSVSRIAGIMAAKKCPDLIPLCHPIALTHVGVELQVFESPASGGSDLGFGGVHIEAKVSCTGPTGVEMEALTSVMGCALSVVDMCKAVDKFQRVGDVRVVLKEGGKSGRWAEEGWRSFQE